MTRWYIRTKAEIGNRPIPPPRVINTLRESLRGGKVVFPMEDEYAMPGWGDGMTTEEMRTYLNRPQAEGTWWINDLL